MDLKDVEINKKERLVLMKSIGKADTLSESPTQTSRREAHEEIGLPLPSSSSSKLKDFQITHLCELPSHLAKTALAVRPCVAYLSPLNPALTDVEKVLIPRLDEREVAAVFTAPLEDFLKKKGEGGYEGVWVEFHGGRWRMHNFYIKDGRTSSDGEEEGEVYRVFGMTARILVDAARVAYMREPEFEHNTHFGDEELIGRVLVEGLKDGEGKREASKM